MQRDAWMLLTSGLLALAFAPGACGGSNGTGGTGGGGTTTATSTSATTGSSSSGSMPAACDAPTHAPSNGACFAAKQPPACPHPGLDGGTTADGGALDCSGLLPQSAACSVCVVGACCAELSSCNASANCWACLTDPNVDPATCQDPATKALLDDLHTCGDGCCTADCFDPGCNPFTNEGCNAAAGEACDLGANGFGCVPAPNDTPICDPCSSAEGPWCEPGMHCIQGACARYCCDDGDCGSGKCDKSILGDANVGLCVPK